jgi:hypothetical protein
MEVVLRTFLGNLLFTLIHIHILGFRHVVVVNILKQGLEDVVNLHLGLMRFPLGATAGCSGDLKPLLERRFAALGVAGVALGALNFPRPLIPLSSSSNLIRG